ncbi:MAG: DUF169 domain-containing protein [Candidatus Eisenbacteria bacterium]|nr:DUF169 domain-containing protein [Candidatus Eisenbacteria bacterium]
MDAKFSKFFVSRWKKYFPGAELPICYFYTDEAREDNIKETKNIDRCLIGNLKRVRKGFPFVYDAQSPGCSGGKRYCGFQQQLMPNFEYFLSYGIPGEIDGERYKKSPELVRAFMQRCPPFKAPAKYLVFKRWDKLGKGEEPFAVIFFTSFDLLSGLFTLANFDRADNEAVFAPMGSGCASIVGYPYLEAKSENPRCVLGMFDISARPHVPKNSLTFTTPTRRFKEMVLNMDESFLTTESWRTIKKRL